MRPGEKGPLEVQAAFTLAEARTEGRPSGVVETLVVFRERQADGTWKHDYAVAHGAVNAPLWEYARVFKAGHRIEECLKRAKSEAGLADYQVRSWEGWHHHQALSLLATWFLTQEARRGKKEGAGLDGAAGAAAAGGDAEPGLGLLAGVTPAPHREPPAAAQRAGAALPLAAPQALAAAAL